MSGRQIAAWSGGIVLVLGLLLLGACNVSEFHQTVKAEKYERPRSGSMTSDGVATELWIIPQDPSVPGALAFRNGGILPGITGGAAAASSGRGGRGGAGGAPAGAVAGRGGGGGAGGGGGRGGGARGPVPAMSEAEMESIPGSPILAAHIPTGELVPMPLKHTEVSADITGYIASVGVTQQFTNPYSEKIEAVYVFPLPENAGINEFVMTIGDRHIRGIVRERAEAERIYEAARAQGYTASLMNQERPNIFTQKVANIEPGKGIDISIKYFHTLSYQDGWYEWVFPMVVGPRYNPAGSTEGVGAIPRGVAGVSGQKTEVQYLRPEERSGHDIGLSVRLDAGVSVEEMVSVNHKIRRVAGKNNTALVQLDPADSVPNKDFVLRYRVAGDKVKTGMFVQKDKDGKGGWFTLMVVPPADLKSLPRRGVEMVFVVDTSGSMNGKPIAQAKAAVDVALSKMDVSDTFQVVKFASGAEQMAAGPVAVSPEAVAAARNYVAAMQGNGGTEMLKGINASLDFPHDDNRTRVVAFLTDGYIGNEVQILKALHEKLQESRVFSFGVGSSPNRYLLDAMARLGHGSAAYLSLNEPAEPVMEQYFERISHPALANVKFDFGGGGSGGMKVTEMYPQRVPELFVGRPIIVTGRYTGRVGSDVVVTGRVGEKEMRFVVPGERAEQGMGAVVGGVQEHGAISAVWARMKIAELHDESIYEGRDVAADVKKTALEYGLMSEVTSFVAVDSSQVTAGDHGTTVAVPVNMPEGVRYETTVGGGRRGGE